MADYVEIANKSFRLVLLYLKNFLINIYRRMIILGKKIGIFWKNRRLGREYQRLGASIFSKLAAGDVNPLLQDEIKDQLARVQSLQDNLAGGRAAIEQIRGQIKATSYRLQPPAPLEPETEPDQPAEP